MKATFKGL